MPYPRANIDNQIPTPCPAFPPNPRRLYIDRCISWPNFSQIGSWVANLEFTCPDFHFEKTGEKDFWQSITRDEIITDYNTKAVNVDVYQRRDNNSDTAGKVKNETRQQMNNLFQRLCSVRSFLLSRKLH